MVFVLNRYACRIKKGNLIGFMELTDSEIIHFHKIGVSVKVLHKINLADAC